MKEADEEQFRSSHIVCVFNAFSACTTHHATHKPKKSHSFKQNCQKIIWYTHWSVQKKSSNKALKPAIYILSDKTISCSVQLYCNITQYYFSKFTEAV